MPDFAHKPVMLAEVLAALRPRPGGHYADGTLGGAGHAEAILDASSPNGWLYGCDRDGAAVEAARKRLERFAGRFEARQGNYADLADWVPAGECDGVLLDLGVSSPQLDDPGRGFSFQQDGPLDMRMDRGQATTAADLVNGLEAGELAGIFWEFGGEKNSRRIAGAIARDRENRLFSRTMQLAELVERVAPRRGKRAHPATKVFQALRIVVNDELNALRRGLAGAFRVLKPDGRLVVITFHSLEDRVVKDFGRERAMAYTYPGEVDIPELRVPRAPEARIVTRKPVTAGEKELAENPRSRSAQLRVLEKV